jgi:hypothetical protein
MLFYRQRLQEYQLSTTSLSAVWIGSSGSTSIPPQMLRDQAGDSEPAFRFLLCPYPPACAAREAGFALVINSSSRPRSRTTARE